MEMGREITLKFRILLWIYLLILISDWPSYRSPKMLQTELNSVVRCNGQKCKYELGDMLRQSWFISLAFLSLSARFPASDLAVSPLYSNQVASCTSACPCAGGQRGRGRGSRWGMVPSTHLPLKYFTCLLSCLCSSTWELGDFSEKW